MSGLRQAIHKRVAGAVLFKLARVRHREHGDVERDEASALVNSRHDIPLFCKRVADVDAPAFEPAFQPLRALRRRAVGEAVRHDPPAAASLLQAVVADGLRGALGSLTFPVVQKLVDQIHVVEEDAIASAMRFSWEQLKLTIEASAAVGVSVAMSDAFRELAQEHKWRGVAIILCGGNVDLDHLPWMK